MQMDANTKMIESMLSGLFDEKIIYNDGEAFETIHQGNWISSSALEAKICFMTGGEYNPKTGTCKHKE